MICARVAGVPSPFSFIASESSLSSSVLPAVSIAVSSVPSVNRFGARVFFAIDSTSRTCLRLSLCEIRRQLSGLPRHRRLLGLFPLPSSSCNVEHLPSDLHDRRAARMKSIVDAAADERDDRGDRPDMVVVPRRQQAAADQVEELAFVRIERSHLRAIRRSE